MKTQQHKNKISLINRIIQQMVILISFSLILVSCGGAEGENPPENGPAQNSSSMTQSKIIAASDECPNGGIQIDSGIDENANGLLDANEIDVSEIVCHGVDGLAGNVGVNGTNGTDGADGINGINGTNGVDGLSGTNGVDGQPGRDGIDGQNGTNGIAGADGLNGINGLDGIDGLNGTNGTDGVDGQNGTNGLDGIDGLNGTNGVDGSNGLNALINQSPEVAGTNCPFGGVHFDVGIDTNRNAVLDAGEVNNTEYICETQNPLADNARLDGLQLSDGQLDQFFQSSLLEYTGSVNFLSSSVHVKAFTEDENASLKVNGIATDSGTLSNPIELAVGGNTVSVEVTAEDGTSIRSYTLNISRQSLQAFAQRAYVKASNTGDEDQFGVSIALYGDTLVVGAEDEGSNSTGVNSSAGGDNFAPASGAVYVFIRTSGMWSQQAYIKASNSENNDQFGTSVALFGDTLAVGAIGEASNGIGVNSADGDDNSAPYSGAVYVFTRTSGAWNQQAYIKASNTGEDDNFGISVALSKNTLAVGANFEESNRSGVNSDVEDDNSTTAAGAVYVFTRTSGLWNQQAYIKASNTGARDNFGISLNLSENSLVVGASGEGSNGTGVNSTAEDDNTSTGSGAVYVFTRTAGLWSQQAYIKASNTGAGDEFGVSVALYLDTLVVGANEEDSNGIEVNPTAEDDNSAFSSGAVYVFTRTAGLWSQQAYIKASNTGTFDHFGASVALSGDTLAVGAEGENSNGIEVNSATEHNNTATDSGAVYVFTRTAGLWSQQAYIKASNTGANDHFGLNVALSEDTLAVGASGEDSNGSGINSGTGDDNTTSDSGAVYVLR